MFGKFFVLCLLAICAIQLASARVYMRAEDDDFMDESKGLMYKPSYSTLSLPWPLQMVHGVHSTVVGFVVHILRVLFFPIRVILRTVTAPFRFIFSVFRMITYPVRRAVHFVHNLVMNILLSIPVVNVPVVILYNLYRLITAPFRLISNIVRAVLF